MGHYNRDEEYVEDNGVIELTKDLIERLVEGARAEEILSIKIYQAVQELQATRYNSSDAQTTEALKRQIEKALNLLESYH